MRDETTLDVERDGEVASASGTVSLDVIPNRPRDRYVPREVTCASCDASGAEFTWFQSVPASDLGPETPVRDLYFCDLVCLGHFCGALDSDDDPATLPVGIPEA